MATRQLPSPEELRQLLRYEPETGKLFWLEREAKWFVSTEGRTAENACKLWNSRYAGKEAIAAPNSQGYLTGSVLSVMTKAHRVIWAIVNGEWPPADVDHINGNKVDNRLCNLRSASRSQNAQNIGVRVNSSSGVKGVRKVKGYDRWTARIMLHGQRHELGYYHSPEAAHEAYRAAAERLHGEFARTE